MAKFHNTLTELLKGHDFNVVDVLVKHDYIDLTLGKPRESGTLRGDAPIILRIFVASYDRIGVVRVTPKTVQQVIEEKEILVGRLAEKADPDEEEEEDDAEGIAVSDDPTATFVLAAHPKAPAKFPEPNKGLRVRSLFYCGGVSEMFGKAGEEDDNWTPNRGRATIFTQKNYMWAIEYDGEHWPGPPTKQHIKARFDYIGKRGPKR